MPQIQLNIQYEPDEYFRLNYVSSIVYAQRESRNLEMRILTPHRVPQILHRNNGFSRDNMAPEFGDNKHLKPRPFGNATEMLPAVIHLMGSGFNGSENYQGLPSFSDLARKGIVVVNIDYRGASLDDTRFPDAIQDVKEAVRFLKVNAEKYGIDKDRITLMGSSSGGYAVTMAGITGDDDPSMLIGDNLDVSSSVNAVIDMFGPVDFAYEREDRLAAGRDVGAIVEEGYSLFRNDVVSDPSLLDRASILKRISPDKKLPEFLILHGDEDKTIPIRQSERLYDALCAAGGDVTFCTINGAGHEFSFNGRVTEMVAAFICGEK